MKAYRGSKRKPPCILYDTDVEVGELQAPTSLSPIKYMFVCLFDYFTMLHLVPAQVISHLHTFHII
jgi:hypothetical protein